MRYTITIEADNAAFGDDPHARRLETSRLLQTLSDDMLSGEDEGPIFDSNGNRVGACVFDWMDGQPKRS